MNTNMHKLPIITMALSLLCVSLALAQNATDRQPPPHLRVPPANGVVYGVAPNTPAPDGIGETVKSAVYAGEYTNDVLTYLPWEDVSVVRPLAAGSSIPADSMVRSASGELFSLNDAVKRQPTVLIFYRGGWCTYCNAHLRELQKSEPELEKLGYQILAVSTDTPEDIRKFTAENPLNYTLLSDTRLEVAERFGLRYKVSETYLKHVEKLDLQTKTGGYLLTPGAFILDTQGVIRFAYVNNNYSVRVSQKNLLQAARDALKN